MFICGSIWSDGFRGLPLIKGPSDYYELDNAIDYVVESMYPNNTDMQNIFTEELIKHITGEYSSWTISNPEQLATGVVAVDAYIAGNRRLRAKYKHVREGK